MANQIIPRNILYINFASVQTKHNRRRHAENQQQNHRGEGCRHKYRISLMTLNEKLFCAKNQSEQSDTPKINCSKSTVCLRII